MPRNTRAVIDWPTVGPRVLAWFAAELPQRSSIIGVYADAHAALGLAGSSEGLRSWVTNRPEWPAIKRTLDTGNGSHALTGASAVSSSPLPPGLTIVQYERQREADEDRARCPVCKLSPAVREEVAEAKRAGLTQARILPALARVHNITIAPTDWAHHLNRRHDQ